MPRAKQTADHILGDGEKPFLEQAKAFYRDLRSAAQHAPQGQVIHHVELLTLAKGREFLRQTAESIVQEQNDVLEKKNTVNVIADVNGNISDTAPITRCPPLAKSKQNVSTAVEPLRQRTFFGRVHGVCDLARQNENAVRGRRL